MIKRLRWVLYAAVVLSASGVTAQEVDDVNVVEEGGKKVIYKARTEISFEGVDVEGEIKKPSGAYMFERKRAKFSPLIKFRLDFDKEMYQSIEEVK